MERFCFTDRTGLPGAASTPTLDGLAEHEPFFATPSFGMDASLVDTGWAGSAKIAYNASVAGAVVGTAVMSFQGMKHLTNNELYLSFVVRRDTGFSEADAIVIAFNQGTAGKSANSRRIDILPLDNHAGFPAVSAAIAAKYTPYTVKQQVFPPAGASVFTVIVSDWNPGANQWQPRAAPAGLSIAVRTWQTATDYNWAVEMRVPTTGWITLDPTFGFYYNVIRACSAAEAATSCPYAPTPFDGVSMQFTFPRGKYFNDPAKLSLIDYPIDNSWFGEAQMGSGCAGFMQGLDFDGVSAYDTIGIRSGAALGGTIDRTALNQFVAKVRNTAPAGGLAATNVTAEFRIANWGIGPSGPTTVNFTTGKWNKVPEDAGSANPTAPLASLAPGSAAELTVNWTLDAAEQALYGGTLSYHQCIWVLLNASNANIVRNSERRNMNVEPMSTFEAKAQVSGVGYDDPTTGSGNHDFLLVTTSVPIARRVSRDLQGGQPRVGGSDSQRVEVGTHVRPEQPNPLLQLLNSITFGLLQRMETVEYRYVWITDGFRLVDGGLNINGKSYAVYTPADSFGVIGQHSGMVESFSDSMELVSGQQNRLLAQSADGRVRRIGVPDEGSTDLQVVLEAKEFPPGCLGLLMAFFTGKLFQQIRSN